MEFQVLLKFDKSFKFSLEDLKWFKKENYPGQPPSQIRFFPEPVPGPFADMFSERLFMVIIFREHDDEPDFLDALDFFLGKLKKQKVSLMALDLDGLEAYGNKLHYEAKQLKKLPNLRNSQGYVTSINKSAFNEIKKYLSSFQVVR